MAEATHVGTSYIVQAPGILGGRPHIEGRRLGVHDVVNVVVRLGGSVEEAVEMYDLTPAQVHAALAYYYDHQAEIDAIIAENARLASEHSDDERSLALKAQARQRMQARRTDPDAEMTATEIAEEFGIASRVVRQTASKGWIPARKSGSTWLIRRQDAQKRWGRKE